MKTDRGRASRKSLIIPARLLTIFVFAAALTAQTNVLTGNYDNFRTNANLSERVLRPSTVAPGLFGRLYSLPVDGQVYAQPLVMRGVEVPGYGARDLLIVATARNTVFAFDADPLGGHAPLWKTNLGNAVPTANYSLLGYYFDDLMPLNGILGTPVIDAATQTLYVVAATLEAGVYAYRLHALDLRTGRAAVPAVEIEGEVEGTGAEDDTGVVRFDAFWHLQRPGLLLANGRVYIAFGSHGGVGPYRGWIFAYSVPGLQRAAVFSVTPDSIGSGIWMSGRGLAADQHGSVFASTGNGPFDGVRSFGESVLKLDANLALQSWFAPADFEELTAADNDLGACGPLLIPGANVLAVGGKVGTVFVLNRGDLGGVKEGNAGAVQQFQPVTASVYNMAAWPRSDGARLYVPGGWEAVKSFRLAEGRFETEPVSQATTGGAIPYYGMALSADGDDPESGILWMTSTEYGYTGRAWPGVLRALDASDLSRELWNSDMNPADALPSYAKFATPTVANGLVFVPTFSNQIVVYGLRRDGQEMEPEIRVSNAFSQTGGTVSPGELVVIDGLGASAVEPVAADPANGPALPTTLGGVRVYFDGEAAPLAEVSGGRITAVAPYSIAGQATALIAVERDSHPALALEVGVTAAHPGLRTVDRTGVGRGDFRNEDGSANSPSNPAEFGSQISIEVTGVGPTEPPNMGFLVAGEAVPAAKLPVTAQVGGMAAEVLSFAPKEGAPGAVFILRIRIPDDTSDGPRIPVIVRVGEFTAPAVTVSVKPRAL